MDDSFTSALARLDPASRALLDLSLRRGMRTEEIAEVLGADPDTVADSRDEALRRVAADVGLTEDEVRARLAELPAEQWTGGGVPRTAAEAEPEPQREETRGAAARKPPITPGASRRRSALPALLGLLLLAGVIVAIAIAGGGDDGGESQGGDTQAQTGEQGGEPRGDRGDRGDGGRSGNGGGATPPEPEGHEGGATFRAIGGGRADGRARLTDGGQRLQIQLRGLPSPPRGGHFEVWLYSSLIESESLGRSRDAVVRLDAKLPQNWEDYRFVDVSLEPSDGNAGHSGASVARVPVDQLAGE